MGILPKKQMQLNTIVYKLPNDTISNFFINPSVATHSHYEYD